MSGKPLAKPHIAIVGAGNLAGALAPALHRAGYVIEQIIARGRGESLGRARQLGREVGATVVVVGGARDKSGIGTGSEVRFSINAEVIWFCVPDGTIAGAARTLLSVAEWKGKVALHSSGALRSDELGRLRRRGAAVASVHPLMTFVRGSRPRLEGVPFAIEGDRKALRAARAMVKDLGGESWAIRGEDKAAYHAWGTFASPLLTALLAICEEVATGAGLGRKVAKRRMLPMLKQTLANYEAYGAAGAFSGPIVRGDVDTVKRHLRVLEKTPAARQVYVGLALAALQYLPAKNKLLLKRALDF